MTVRLFTGATGCGKTYKAITEAKESFIITVPCRQLAYEIFWDYPRISRIDTGEVHMGDPGNQVCVYENLPNGVIEQDTLIVDEAHYLNDPDRGGALFEKIFINKQAGKKIILLTATDTISDEVKGVLGIEEFELESFCEIPEKVELAFPQFCEKVKSGMTTIVFTKYTPSLREIMYYANSFGIDEESIRVLSANTPSYERVKTQIDFKLGKVQVIIATNVLAQGLNFPAQGVLIEYNEWDTWEIVSQKLGRVARPLFGLREGYYYLRAMPGKRKHRGVPEKLERDAQTYWRPSNVGLDISNWGFMEHEVPWYLWDEEDDSICTGWEYKGIKYSYRFLRELHRRLQALQPEEQEALDFLEEQSELVRKLLAGRPLIREAA